MKIVTRPCFSHVRVKLGYTITSLAKAMNVHPGTVVCIETNKGKNGVRPDTAKKACEVLGMAFDDLFVIEDDMVP